MAVMHVVPGHLLGGIERIQLTLAQVESTSRPSFAICQAGTTQRALEQTGADCYLIGMPSAGRPSSWLPPHRALREAIVDAGVNQVVFHSLWAWLMLAAAARGVQRALVLHDHIDPNNLLQQAARWQRPDRLICVSHSVAAASARHWPSLLRAVWYPPVPLRPVTRDRAAIRRALTADSGDFVIVQASRLDAGKGHETLIAALAMLPPSAAWQLWLLGGAQRPADQARQELLRQKIASAGLEARVRWVGQVDQVQDYLAAADLYCQINSGREAFGLCYVEAMQQGLPVIASDRDGPAEIIRADCGFLVRPNHAAAVAAHIQDLIGHMPRAQAMGAAGMERAKQLSDPERQCAALAQLLAAPT